MSRLAAVVALALAHVFLVPSAATAGGWTGLDLPKTSVVTVKATDDSAGLDYFFRAEGTGRYAAIYVPALNLGWVHIVDPQSPEHFSIDAPFGKYTWPTTQPTFVKGREYTFFIALDRPGRLVLPPGFRVVRVHPRELHARVSMRRVHVPAGSSRTVTGAMPSSIGSMPLSAVAIAVDYRHASGRITSGDACTTPLQAALCPPDPQHTFSSTNWDLQTGVAQDWFGRAYSARQTFSYISGAFEVVYGNPFERATLFAFGFDPLIQ